VGELKNICEIMNLLSFLEQCSRYFWKKLKKAALTSLTPCGSPFCCTEDGAFCSPH